MTVRIGAMLRREIPPSEVIGVAQNLQHRFDELWVVEDLPYAGGISQATAVLAATESVLVGHGIAPAPFRNPAALAMEWATLAEMYPGRFLAGIGHGVQTWMAQIGERVDSPIALLRETMTAVRRLLAGERVTIDGRYVHIDDVSLEFTPTHRPPVFAGVTGPRSLALSGEVGDGTILGEGSGPAEIESALATIAEGTRRAGRTDHHHLTVFAAFAVGTADGHTMPNDGWNAIAPTPAAVATRLQKLIDAGADSVVLVPFGRDAIADLESASTQIVPSMTRA